MHMMTCQSHHYYANLTLIRWKSVDCLKIHPSLC